MEVGAVIGIIKLFTVGVIQIVLPILVIILVVALIFGVLQSVTQVQEQSLTFFPKLFALIVVLLLSGNWMYKQAVSSYTEYFEQIIRMF